MDYERFEIRNKHDACANVPMQTSGFICRWTDAYITNVGFHRITLRDMPTDRFYKSCKLSCALPAEGGGLILGLALKEINDLVIEAVHKSSRTNAFGRLVDGFSWSSRAGKRVLVIDEIEFEED